MDVLAVFEDFSKGHYGDNPATGPGFFGGENMLPVAGGRALKIREGTLLLDNTATTNASDVVAWPVSGGLVVSSGTATDFIPSDGAASSSLGTSFSATVLTACGWCHYRAGVLVTNYLDQTYYVTAAGPSALATSPGGVSVAVLGDRIYVANMSGFANRIRWSNAASETGWAAGNVLDVGVSTQDEVHAIVRQRNSLVVQHGGNVNVGQWSRLSGTPGTPPAPGNQTLVPIQPYGPQIYPTDAIIAGYNSRLWFGARPADDSIEADRFGWLDADTPVTAQGPAASNSSGATSATNVGRTAVATVIEPPMTLISNVAIQAIAVPTQRHFLQRDGVWTQHVFPLTGMTVSSFYVRNVGGEGLFYIYHGGSGATKPNFYSWRFSDSLEVAPREVDITATTVAGIFSSPLTFSQDNSNFHVQAVVVDYRHFSTNTRFTVNVDSYGGFDAPTVAGTASAITVSGLGAPGTVGGLRRSYVPTGNVGQVGAGFIIRLSDCRAVAIERVTVLGERTPSY